MSRTVAFEFSDSDDEKDVVSGGDPDPIPVSPAPESVPDEDPMVEFVNDLITGERNGPVESPPPTPPPPVAPPVDRVDRMVKEIKQLDALADSKHREKLRRMEETGRAADRVAKAVKISEFKEEHTLPGEGDAAAYDREWRKFEKYKRMGVAGSGKRLTYGVAKFTALCAEVDLMRSQVNEGRGDKNVEGFLIFACGLIEGLTKGNERLLGFSLKGLQDAWKTALEEDPGLKTALEQLKIEYAHWLAISPEKFVALRFVNIARETATYNKLRAVAPDVPYDEEAPDGI